MKILLFFAQNHKSKNKKNQNKNDSFCCPKMRLILTKSQNITKKNVHRKKQYTKLEIFFFLFIFITIFFFILISILVIFIFVIIIAIFQIDNCILFILILSDQITNILICFLEFHF